MMTAANCSLKYNAIPDYHDSGYSQSPAKSLIAESPAGLRVTATKYQVGLGKEVPYPDTTELQAHYGESFTDGRPRSSTSAPHSE